MNMWRPWRTSAGMFPWLLLTAAVLGLAVLFKTGLIPRRLDNDTATLINAVSNLTQVVVLSVGGVLSYFKFFKGRTLSPRLVITPQAGRVAIAGEQVFWVEAQIENKGSVTIWNYAVTVYAVLHRDEDERVTVARYMPHPPGTELSEKLIESGESVFEHAFLPVPADATAVTFQIVVQDQSRATWWRNITVGNSAPSGQTHDKPTHDKPRPAQRRG